MDTSEAKVLEYPAPTVSSKMSVRQLEAFVLQASHRVAIVSFLALTIAWAMLVRVLSDPSHGYIFKTYRHFLAAAFAGGDIALAGGVLAMALAYRRGGTLREARGLILWGATIALLALPVLVLARLGLMKL